MSDKSITIGMSAGAVQVMAATADNGNPNGFKPMENINYPKNEMGNIGQLTAMYGQQVFTVGSVPTVGSKPAGKAPSLIS